MTSGDICKSVVVRPRLHGNVFIGKHNRLYPFSAYIYTNPTETDTGNVLL